MMCAQLNMINTARKKYNMIKVYTHTRVLAEKFPGGGNGKTYRKLAKTIEK